jgi:hypothetical protein
VQGEERRFRHRVVRRTRGLFHPPSFLILSGLNALRTDPGNGAEAADPSPYNLSRSNRGNFIRLDQGCSALERIRMQEQRATPRVRSYLAGRVLFPNGISTMDCAVRDISSCGARLQVTSTAGLPGHFRLHIPQRERTYDVRVRWIAQQEIGVSFEVASSDTRAASDQDTTLDLRNRLVRLEAEVRQLRQLVQTLSSGPQAAQRG